MSGDTLKFSDYFHLREELGKGAFSIVYKCVEVGNNKEYAAKVIKKEKLSKRDLIKLEMEARICKKLNHPNIVKLQRVISEAKMHYLVFDLVTGGELFDDLVHRADNYSEELAAQCILQILETVSYIHSMGVVHRDLKPENILLESKSSRKIKIADFGLAVELGEEEAKWFGLGGTPNYMAPEVVGMKPYGRPVDVWACGVILYIMLVGYLPFYHTDKRVLNSQITNGDYDLSSEHWTKISDDAKDLIEKLLCVVPSRRLSANDALGHRWFKKPSNLVNPGIVDRLAKFNAKRKFKAAVHTNMIMNAFMSMKKSKNVGGGGGGGGGGSTGTSSSTSSSKGSSGAPSTSRRS